MVKIDFEELMRSKSDEGLRVYIDDSMRYQPEAVQAAMAELERRGNPVQEPEIVEIKQQMEYAIQNEKKAFKFAYDQEHLVTDDVNAPLLYSRRAIFLSTVFMGALFGSILMAINIRRNNYQGIVPVLLFGALYTVSLIILTANNPTSIKLLTIPMALLAGTIIADYFWPKYIGKETIFRRRSVLIPVIIWLVVTIAGVIISYSATSIK